MDSMKGRISCDICPQIYELACAAFERARNEGSPDPISEAVEVAMSAQMLWPDRFLIIDGHHDCDECEETRRQLYDLWSRQS